MRLPSTTAGQHNFARAPQVSVQRSSFDRSYGVKTTFDAGYLIPIFVDEALPGDTFNVNMTGFARLATPLTPFFDNLYMDTHFFAVPLRLVWNNFQKFMGEQDNPGDSISYLVPQMVSTAVTGYLENSIFDYFTLPTKVPGLTHSVLPFRAYNLCYNQWFRDQNFQNSVVVNKGDGPDLPADYTLLRRGKRHDYFTSCLPSPQKGAAVSLPLGTTAPVKSDGNLVYFNQGTNDRNPIMTSGSPTVSWASNPTATAGVKAGQVASPATTGYVADLSTATAATINQLRQAFQIQKLLERDARGGSRYVEIIHSHFRVVSADGRLQRPEYLGGGSSPIVVNPIAQTSAAAAQPTPQGTLTAIGTAVLSNHGFVKSFTEHCIIIGVVSVRADLNYQQGLEKQWSRSTRYDFFWPELAHIGEQAVLNKEIYAVGTGGATDDGVFGYQERYAEYRYKPSVITGNFRSNHTAKLDQWHLAQNFTALPTLNSTFIVENPPVDRVKALAADYPDFLFDSWFTMHCARPMPTYSVPGYIDHF